MLKPQFINLVNSSFLLYLDNEIMAKGSGISYTNSSFYPIGTWGGKYVYSSKFQGIVANENVSGNISPTGIYLSGSYVLRGNSGFYGYNYDKGWALFNNNVGDYTKVSGAFYIKDINILPLQVSEDKLLFETQFKLRGKANPTTPTGLNFNEYTYPAIYVKAAETVGTKPFAFGGQDESEINMGLFIFADSAYQLDCLKSICADMAHSYVPLLTQDKVSIYDIYGSHKNTGVNYNYATTSASYVSNGSGLYISDVNVSTFGKGYGRTLNSELMSLNPDVYWCIADFSLKKPRYPRSLTNNL